LQNCNPENIEVTKKKMMVNLKPSEADEAYEYFTRIESDYIFENYKVHAYQVLPKYGDYYDDNSSLNDIFLDEDTT
jgi:hypothetical protein